MNELIKELHDKAFEGMNERIKELHDKAFEGNNILEPNWFLKHNKKFAELIVRECMDVVLDKDGKEWAGYVHVCREESAGMIKKHFGVE
jgi:hypothetical protein